MRYVMKQKLLAWGDDFYIKDEAGHDVYFVDGKALSFGDKLSFKDLEGNELAYIEQKVFSLRRTYNIYRGGTLAAVVQRELFALFRHTFTVDVPGPRDLEAKGDFLDHEYSFERDGRVVATVSKRWFSWSDTYGVEIDDDEDAVLVLASAVVVDQACHPDGEGRH